MQHPTATFFLRSGLKLYLPYLLSKLATFLVFDDLEGIVASVSVLIYRGLLGVLHDVALAYYLVKDGALTNKDLLDAVKGLVISHLPHMPIPIFVLLCVFDRR